MNSTLEKREVGRWKLEVGSRAVGGEGKPEWWVVLPPGERHVLGQVMGMFRGLKRSRVPRVARAAAKWERGLACFIKVRLKWEKRKAENRNGNERSEIGGQRAEGGEPAFAC